MVPQALRKAVSFDRLLSKHDVHAAVGRPRNILVGSRDKLCANPAVRAHPGGVGNQMCRKLVATRSCAWWASCCIQPTLNACASPTMTFGKWALFPATWSVPDWHKRIGAPEAVHGQSTGAHTLCVQSRQTGEHSHGREQKGV